MTFQLSKTQKTLTLTAAVLLAFAGGLWAAQSLFPAISTASHADPLADNFTLSEGNRPIQLADFRGKIALIYFGYMSCPDVCPTSLAMLGSALKMLTPEEIAQIQPIFISVDPERDNHERLMDYAQYFHPSFIGVTGSTQEIQRVAMQYGAFYSKAPSTSALGYLIDHSSNTYLVGRDGKLVNTITHASSKDEIVKLIRQAL